MCVLDVQICGLPTIKTNITYKPAHLKQKLYINFIHATRPLFDAIPFCLQVLKVNMKACKWTDHPELLTERCLNSKHSKACFAG